MNISSVFYESQLVISVTWINRCNMQKHVKPMLKHRICWNLKQLEIHLLWIVRWRTVLSPVPMKADTIVFFYYPQYHK